MNATNLVKYFYLKKTCKACETYIWQILHKTWSITTFNVYSNSRTVIVMNIKTLQVKIYNKSFI